MTALFGNPAETKEKVTISIDVPDPTWTISIDSVHLLDGKLLFACQAQQKEGAMGISMISKASASVELPKSLAKLPKKIYLLGQGWNWQKGYHKVTEEELALVIKDAKIVFQQPQAAVAKPTVEDFIGLSLTEAEKLANKHKLPHRVIMIEGKHLPSTRDYRPHRLNFTIEKAKVAKVTKG